jgi:transposase
MARKFSKELKVQACELVQKEGAKPKIVAEKMGLNITVFYRWLSDYATYGEEAFVGRGYQRTEEAKVKRIEKENKMLKQENEILKKAAAYFAKEKGKD